MFGKAIAAGTVVAVVSAVVMSPLAGGPASAAPQIPVAGVVEPVPGHPDAVPAAQLMSEVVTRTNQIRHRFGCAQLAVDHALIDASVQQSYYMATSHRFSHIGRGGSTFMARAHAAGYARPAGENIAWGYGTSAQVVAAWLASPRHRANMLNCGARSIGTGVVYADDGIPYYTELFGWV